MGEEIVWKLIKKNKRLCFLSVLPLLPHRSLVCLSFCLRSTKKPYFQHCQSPTHAHGYRLFSGNINIAFSDKSCFTAVPLKAHTQSKDYFPAQTRRRSLAATRCNPFRACHRSLLHICVPPCVRGRTDVCARATAEHMLACSLASLAAKQLDLLSEHRRFPLPEQFVPVSR